jgi:transcriptional regulator with PAS, ATPase and Fis domain
MSSLELAKEITDKMRWHEAEIMRINTERRKLIRKAWKEEGVAQAKIAVALGITNQTIWNEIHKADSE